MKKSRNILESLQAILIALTVALILRQFVVAAYKIPSGSMEDTLLVGDFLLVNKFVYGAEMPEWVGIPFTRWKEWPLPTGFDLPEQLHYRFPAIAAPQTSDIVVFRYPRNPSLEYVKRCIALEGETLEILNKTVYVDGRQLAEAPGFKASSRILRRGQRSYQLFRPELGSQDNFGPLQVARHSLFVMGDNRDMSDDSRHWGFVPLENVVGKPLITYLSLETDPDGTQLLGKIRWERLGMVVR